MGVPLVAPHERTSQLWLKLREHFEKRLAVLRARNDKPASVDRSNVLRGQIAELKHLLQLADEKSSVPPEDELFRD